MLIDHAENGELTKPVADTWYTMEPMDHGLLRLRESHIDPFFGGLMWLAEGRDAALLIDTGSGIVPLRPTLAALTNKPILAVALNCFYDHAGGLHDFDQRLAHEADQAAIEAPDGKTSAVEEFVSDDMLLALPRPGYTTAGYAMAGATLTRPLQDGDEIDLGDRRLEVIHTPGVTPGSICLWESAAGQLFASDTLFLSPDGTKALPRNRGQFLESLARLAALPVETVHPGHYDSFGRDTMDRLVESYA